MKKFIILLLILTFIVPFNVKADEEYLKNAKSGILMEYTTGSILYDKNKDDRVSIASLTKMMTGLIILEKIDEGVIKWNDIITTSSYASSMGGTQIWLSTGEKISVEDLFKSMFMASANDAAVALAEAVSGSEENFVKLMNAKKEELKLKNTEFKNCTGFDEEGHFSSAYDLAVIARELLKHDEILKYTSVYEDYIRKDTPNKYWLVNTNKLVRFYEGADGFKTGFTDDALYTIAATAKRNNLRLIAIVLGSPSGSNRNEEAMELLDDGFFHYKIDLVKSKGEIVDKLKIDKGNVDYIDVEVKDELSVLSKKSDASINYDTKIYYDQISLPIKKGDKIGKIDILYNGKVLKSSDLCASNDVKKVNYFKYLFSDLKNVMSGNFF